MPHTAILGLLIGALAVAAPPLHATEGDELELQTSNFCSVTASVLHRACGHEKRDDLLVAKAKCLSIADAARRATCFEDARTSHREGVAECRARRDWRRLSCTVLGEERYDPPFEPAAYDADFRALTRPNPYFPLTIGNRWEYAGGTEQNIVEVANETKLVAGVTCVVVRDLVYDEGKLREATDDWFAAGRDGHVWYCGEEVKDYASFAGDNPQRPELVSRDGSFKHGRDGDKGGIMMPAQPRAGQWYREEFSLGNAEDVSEVVAADYGYGASAALDAGVPQALAERLCRRDCVVTRNYSLLEPNRWALKYYAKGIGLFLETKPTGGTTMRLVTCNFDPRCVSLP